MVNLVYKSYFKRFFDLVISLVLLILTSPVFILATVLLYFANDGKIFFIQPRPGLNEKIFKIIKFKTMNDRKNDKGELFPDKDRITTIGSIIRKSSIDELPQLINVIKGELSLVGPRPLLVEYLPLYNDFQKRRHEVRPGITGWAQVNGRNTISWKQKFEFDIWYVENTSFLLDLKIIYLTIIKVTSLEGINYTTHVTMEKFTGNN